MATLIKMKSKDGKESEQYYSDFRFKGKRIRKPLGTDKRLALKKLGEMISDLKNQDTQNMGDISWAQVKERWLLIKETKSRKTWHFYRKAFIDLEKFAPVRKVGEITPDLLVAFYTHMKKNGFGLAIRNKTVCMIIALRNDCSSRLGLNPVNWKEVHNFMDPETKGRLRWHTKAEVEYILNAARNDWDDRILTIVMLGCFAGLRRGEIAYLRHSDIDLANRQIHITQKPGIWTPKDKEMRIVHIPQFLVDYLATLRGETWVLPNYRGDPHNTVSLTQFYIRFAKRHKIQGTIHTLRHTYGSHLAQLGVPLYHIQNLMGHSSPQTTEIYAHLSNASLAAGVSKLDTIAPSHLQVDKKRTETHNSVGKFIEINLPTGEETQQNNINSPTVRP